MLKEKDRKTIVLLVVFGVALVSLVTAVIACFTNSLAILCNFDELVDFRYSDLSYYNTVAAVLIVFGALGIAYFCVRLFVRKTFIPSLVLAGVVVCYFIASAFALWAVMPTVGLVSGGQVSETYLSTEEFTFFQTNYIAVAVTLAISVALAETSGLLLKRMDRKAAKEQVQQAEPQVAVDEQ